MSKLPTDDINMHVIWKQFLLSMCKCVACQQHIYQLSSNIEVLCICIVGTFQVKIIVMSDAATKPTTYSCNLLSLLGSKCQLNTSYIVLPYVLTSQPEAWHLCLDKVLYTHINYCSGLPWPAAVSDLPPNCLHDMSLQNVRL